jgi:hypothetical protein
MTNRTESKRLAVGLTALGVLGRLAPHAPNVTPVGGSCLFAGSRISGWLAYLLPIAVMLVTDPFVGGYRLTSFAVYAAFLINVWIGRRIASRATAMRVGAAAFCCSLQFFLITNFAVWLSASTSPTPSYAMSLNGLTACYLAALPFWGRTLAGDLLFSAALFGIYELLRTRLAEARIATV